MLDTRYSIYERLRFAKAKQGRRATSTSHEIVQTKRQIQELLTATGVQPNKRFGQHFLIDLNLMRLLIESANISSNDVVLEVGCATGSLTESLVQRAGKVIAVELDKILVEIAKKQLAKVENVEFLNVDILENKNTINQTVIEAIKKAHKKQSGRILLVANLPYNVASPVMVNLVKGPTIVDGMFVTVQKEVADRMTAVPGRSDYGILSIFLHATGDVKKIRVLKPTVFWPQPQVDSAMVSFRRDLDKSARIADMELFGRIVNLFMSHRRKTLLASSRLARGEFMKNWPEILKKCSINPQKRPEQLNAEDYITITNEL
jgi:16S rRNA (adenine1518-N6/adenine1519-N6)-dimethyltransferase